MATAKLRLADGRECEFEYDPTSFRDTQRDEGVSWGHFEFIVGPDAGKIAVTLLSDADGTYILPAE